MDGGSAGMGDVEFDSMSDTRNDGPSPMKKVRGDQDFERDTESSHLFVTGLGTLHTQSVQPISGDEAESGGAQNDLVNVMDEDEEEAGSETKLYCTCRAHYDEERMMIACDRCDEWYHAVCMDVNEEQADLVDVFICPRCEKETEQRTTWKLKCRQSECIHAALHPLSRFCSERCGVMAASQRIANLRSKLGQGTGRKMQNDKMWAERTLGDERLQRARKRESLTVWNLEASSMRLDWLESVLGDKAADQIRAMTNKFLSEHSLDQSDIDHLLSQLEELSTVEGEKARVSRQMELVNVTLDLLAARTKILHLAEDRSALLEPVRIDESAEGAPAKASKKSKSKKGALETSTDLPSRGQPRCGYDERLHWDDRRFISWTLSETGKAILAEEAPLDGTLDDGEIRETESDAMAGQVSVCGSSKRKCKRHADWSVARGYDFDLDRESHMRLLEGLSNEQRELDTRTLLLVKQLRTTFSDEQQRHKKADAALAQALALEGSRRAPPVS